MSQPLTLNSTCPDVQLGVRVPEASREYDIVLVVNTNPTHSNQRPVPFANLSMGISLDRTPKFRLQHIILNIKETCKR